MINNNIKDNEIGIVFNIKNNEYEPMNVKEILDKSMDKIYKHLSDFFNEIILNKKIDKKIEDFLLICSDKPNIVWLIRKN